MKPFQPEDILRYRTLQGLDGSPAHDRVVVVVGRAKRSGYRSVVWQLACGGETPRPLTASGFPAHAPTLSPDGTRLAFLSRRADKHAQVHLLPLADADGGHARRLEIPLASVMAIRWAPGSDRISFAGSHREGDSLLRLWWADLGDDSVHCIGGEDDAAELELALGAAVWHPDGDRLAVVAAHRGLQRIATVALPHGPTRHLSIGLRNVIGLAARGGRLAFVAASVRKADELYSVDWDGGEQQCHSAFNRRWFAARDSPRACKRRYRVPCGDSDDDGEETIEAWLLLPPHRGDGPFPLLVDLHGGPQSMTRPDFTTHTYWYLLCSRGWAVLGPNAVGSGSYGARFARRLRGHWGERDLPQVLAVIRQLQAQGIADDRVACTGGSYGGFLSAWAIGHTDVFKAAVVSAPVADIESHAGTSDTGYYVAPYAMDGEISRLRERCRRLSPVEYCAQVHAATLLLQGQDDQRCPLGQSEELFANLVHCSQAPVQMVVYPGGSHHVSSSGKPAHRIDYHRRLAAWVQHWAGNPSQAPAPRA